MGVDNSSSNSFVRVPPQVNFVADIVLYSFPFSCAEATDNEKNLSFKQHTPSTMTETFFNKHITTSSSASAHSKYVSKLSVAPKSSTQ